MNKRKNYILKFDYNFHLSLCLFLESEDEDRKVNIPNLILSKTERIHDEHKSRYIVNTLASGLDLNELI